LANNTYISSNGRIIPIRPVAAMALQILKENVRKECVEEGLQLSAPTYTVVTGVGVEETYTHDDESIKTATPEEQRKWKLWELGINELTVRTTFGLIRLILTKGVKLPPLDAETREGWEELGVTFPEDKASCYIAYMKLEYLPTPADVQNLTRAILALSQTGAPKEQIDAVEALFRR